MTAARDEQPALAPIRVVEIGEGIATAVCGRWLAAFGAEVIRVEPPGGEWTRRCSVLGDGAAGADAGALFRALHPGKQSLTLDLALPADRAVLHGLVAQADIVVHSLQPAELAALGLDLAALRRARPRLVSVGLLPFGSDGPYAGYAASANVLLALGGYQNLSGEPGRQPLALPGYQPEYLTGCYGVIAALAALHAVQRDGRGSDVEVASLEALASLHQFTVSKFLYQGRIRSRHGNSFEDIHPQVVLPCRDGYVGLCLPSQEMWARMCLLMERPDLLEDPRFATPLTRFQHAGAVDAVLVAWLREQPRLEFFHRAQQEWRLAVAPVYDVGEVLAEPQLTARGFWVVPEGADDAIAHAGLPVAMSESQWRLRRSPLPGEHDAALRARVAAAQEPVASETPVGTVAGEDGEAVRRPDPRYPLAGLRVLDFTRVWAGPLAARILADLGAEVIRIERPVELPTPAAGTPLQAAVSTFTTRFSFGPGNKHNRNKQSVGVDLGTVRGRELVRRLAARSDVIIENFSARVMPNFGLDYATLRRDNPGLIMIAMSGCGASGPYRNYVSYGPSIEAFSGLVSLLGYADGPPVASAIAYPDATAGVNAAAAILTALAHRDRTGAGQFIDFSQLEAATTAISEYFIAYQLTGRLPARLGNAHPEYAPHGTYRCAGPGGPWPGQGRASQTSPGGPWPGQGRASQTSDDGWLSLAVRNEAEWAGFCAATGLTALRDDPAYATPAARRRNAADLDAAIGAWTRQRTKLAAMAALQRAGVPAGAVLNAQELLQDPQLARRGFYVDAPGTDGAAYRMPGTPIRVNGAAPDAWRPAPLIGEHNRAVLQEVLGLGAEEIDALEAEGVLGTLTRAEA